MKRSLYDLKYDNLLIINGLKEPKLYQDMNV